MTKQKENPKKLLAYGDISELIKYYSIPAIISMLVMSAYNITDQIFIGRVVGMYGNAATNVVFPLVTFACSFSQLLGIGTASNFNIKMGEKKHKEAKNYITTGIFSLFIMGIIIFLISFFFKNNILFICGASENVFNLANRYLSITLWGLPFLLISSGLSFIIRADGSPSYSMFSNVIGAVINIILDAYFMLVLDWNIEGAALATVIGQVVSFIFAIFYFRKFKSFDLKFSMLSFKFSYAISIAELGFSNFINFFIMMLVNIILNNVFSYYGGFSIYGSDIPLAVSGVASKISSILSAFSVGLAQGFQLILGFNMGAKNYKRVKKTYVTALKYALIMGGFAFLILQIFPREITGIFGKGDEIYFEFAEKYLRTFLLMVGVFCLQPITVNYFAAIGDVKRSVLLSVSRQGFFLIPLLMFLPNVFGIEGALYAGPIADTWSCLLAIILIKKNFKYLTFLENKKNKTEI